MSEEKTPSPLIEDVAHDLLGKYLDGNKNVPVLTLILRHTSLICRMECQVSKITERLMGVITMLSQSGDIGNIYSGANYEALEKICRKLEDVMVSVDEVNTDVSNTVAQSRRCLANGIEPKTASGRHATPQETKKLMDFVAFVETKSLVGTTADADSIINFLKSIAK